VSGRALVEALAREGARVLGVDAATEGLAELGTLPNITTAVLDITHPHDLETVIDETAARWGRLDVLCNNATIADALHSAEDCPGTEWQQNLAFHLHAPFTASRRALAHMLPARHGMILNTVATAGLTGAAGGAAYTASEHALVGLTRSIAAMYATDGIRAIAISPTPTNDNDTAGDEPADPTTHLIRRARARTRDAFTRHAHPTELASLAIYLTTGGADLLNGAILPANSGYSAH
jgi:NAD(P)-dependent dehydrogenase (short-subunit alcohol dehydrogenase family)